MAEVPMSGNGVEALTVLPTAPGLLGPQMKDRIHHETLSKADLNPTDRLLSAETLAAKLDCSVKHARTLMSNGTLPKVRLARRCVRTPLAAVETFIAKKTINASRV